MSNRQTYYNNVMTINAHSTASTKKEREVTSEKKNIIYLDHFTSIFLRMIQLLLHLSLITLSFSKLVSVQVVTRHGLLIISSLLNPSPL